MVSPERDFLHSARRVRWRSLPGDFPAWQTYIRTFELAQGWNLDEDS
ncbi:Transposase [Nostoc flagelliforme CCNUN1]|uniref:Transposase n=1 Tax=Nostoc flagelliforme CCNUN1 TaxID=2038116 RepID=A0A2K8T230_9NOSO|nr:Transposase [Nostoc flagelliforme CCNUN1]